MPALKRIAAVTVAAAAFGAASGLTAPAAHAATAPACVGRYVLNDERGFYVFLSNNCAKTMRVQVIVDWAPDSPCYTIAAGGEKTYRYNGILGLYDSTAVC
ncbi:beta-Ig-H3/fasciclin [Streptomyces sp. NPDC059459]|uniref:beta-Ig-H3/fasciclin n=1 Tax=unclassified Streptomyces TaxID=2593676 RepID=UPI00367FF752